MGRRRWEDVKRDRLAAMAEGDTAAYRLGYERAKVAFELGEQARTMREALGMTQTQVAEKVGTTQSAIARLESGGVEPKFETLGRIGAALGANLVVRFEARRRAPLLQPT